MLYSPNLSGQAVGTSCDLSLHHAYCQYINDVSFSVYPVGTPVMAYGHKTEVTEIVNVNTSEPEYSNYMCRGFTCMFWHKELTPIPQMSVHTDE